MRWARPAHLTQRTLWLVARWATQRRTWKGRACFSPVLENGHPNVGEPYLPTLAKSPPFLSWPNFLCPNSWTVGRSLGGKGRQVIASACRTRPADPCCGADSMLLERGVSPRRYPPVTRSIGRQSMAETLPADCRSSNGHDIRALSVTRTPLRHTSIRPADWPLHALKLLRLSVRLMSELYHPANNSDDAIRRPRVHP